MRRPKPWYRKQDQNWYAQIDGQKIKLGPDEDAARDEFDRLMRRRQLGEPLGNQSVREVLAAYVLWLKANRASTTCERRKALLKSFGQSVPAALKIRELKGHHVWKWINGMSYAKGKKRKGAALSPTTINTRITMIQTVANWSVKMGYIGVNPIAKMEKPAALIRQDFLPVDTWETVLAAATGSFKDFVIVMLDSGARPQEMYRFEARHYKDSRFVLPIAESKGRRKARVVYLPEPSRQIVERLVAEFPEGNLFRNDKGIPWNADSIKCRFDRLKLKLKMPKLCATTLRHSFAHYRLTSGQDALTVAKLMGHVDTRMVSTRYGHLDDNVEYMHAAANQTRFPIVVPIAPAAPNTTPTPTP